MNPKLYPRDVIRKCAWCGTDLFLYAKHKDHLRNNQFCKGTDCNVHHRAFAKSHKNFKPKEARRTDYLNIAGDTSYLENKERKQEKLLKEVAIVNEDYITMLRKHKMQSCSGLQACTTATVMDRSTAWEANEIKE